MPDETEWQSIGQEVDLSWKDLVRPNLALGTHLCPNVLTRTHPALKTPENVRKLPTSLPLPAQVIPIMTYFEDRTPGTSIEQKESSLAWHYRDADPQFGAWQAKDMQLSMEDVLSTLPLDIIQSNHMVRGISCQLTPPAPSKAESVRHAHNPSLSTCVALSAWCSQVEVRHRAVSKASVVEKVLEHLSSPDSVAAHDGAEADFVFCVGDDRSDEDMFQLLKRSALLLQACNFLQT